MNKFQTILRDVDVTGTINDIKSNDGGRFSGLIEIAKDLLGNTYTLMIVILVGVALVCFVIAGIMKVTEKSGHGSQESKGWIFRISLGIAIAALGASVVSFIWGIFSGFSF